MKGKAADTSKYDSLSDEELIRLLRSGKTDVENYLLEKYKQLVRLRAREYYLAGGDREDLLQEGMVGLFRAVRTYDPEREASFRSYASLLVSRQMMDAVLSAQRMKNQALNTSIPISLLEENGEESSIGLAESPESIVISLEDTDSRLSRLREQLSPLENRVLEHFLAGEDYILTAEKLGRTPKSVDNALQRIRSKAAALRAADE